MPEIVPELPCSGNSVPERPFRAYLAPGKARHVKTTKKRHSKITPLGSNSQQLGKRGLLFLLFFCGCVEQDKHLCPKPNYLKFVWDVPWRAHQVQGASEALFKAYALNR